MNNKLKSVLFRRMVLVGLLIVLQLALFLYLILNGSRLSQAVNGAFRLLSLIAALSAISRHTKGEFKTSWVFLILLFPLFGGMLYIFFNFQSSTKSFRTRAARVEKKTGAWFALPETARAEALRELEPYKRQITYLQDTAGFPVYRQTQVSYYSPGEVFLPALLEALEQAEKYIFIETFILEEGQMWDRILEILKRKAAAGVKVRLLYDDIGCLLLLPKKYADTMRKCGIETQVFNRFRPFLTVSQNNRDHRKITVIDGKVAFTGGINMADEYINAYEKHGYWKDASVKVEGKAAWSLTLIFLQNWELCAGTGEDAEEYYPYRGTPCETANDGFVQPYADSPLDEEHVSEHVYRQIIADAKEYLYITTPYLIIDETLISSLTLAAKSGVDVRIITPYHWDKRLVHMTTRSYYRTLMDGGVKIYEYTPGFIHSKTFVSDGRVATVGTVNLDFRSLYLHFECGVRMYDCRAVDAVRRDFLATMAQSHEMKPEELKNSFLHRLFCDVLRLFAPLM